MSDKLPVRKPVRLESYDYSSAGMYFITVCTKGKRPLLCRIVGGGALDAPQVRLTKSGKVLEKYILSSDRIPQLHVVKYVIMPNHFHLLLAVREDPDHSEEEKKQSLFLHSLCQLSNIYNN